MFSPVFQVMTFSSYASIYLLRVSCGFSYNARGVARLISTCDVTGWLPVHAQVCSSRDVIRKFLKCKAKSKSLPQILNRKFLMQQVVLDKLEMAKVGVWEKAEIDSASCEEISKYRRLSGEAKKRYFLDIFARFRQYSQR